MKYLIVIVTLLGYALTSAQSITAMDNNSAKISSNAELMFNIDRKTGWLPTTMKNSLYSYSIRNPFSSDSGTGNTHSGIMNISLKTDTSKIESMLISSDQPYLVFKSVAGAGKQNPFPNYVTSGNVFNLTKGNYLDLDLKFIPPKTMKPGYYTANLLFTAKELNDSGYVNVDVPIWIFYNPYEWFDSTSKPGIELFLVSKNIDTTNLIFGSHYRASMNADTCYAEGPFDYIMRNFQARFYIDSLPYTLEYGIYDIAPNDEKPYSNSRDIREFKNESTPLIYHVKFFSKATDYPLKLEYEDINFPQNSTFLLYESLDSNSKFKSDMREIAQIQPSRHQFVISDTTIKEFYIIYYRNKKLTINTDDPKPMKLQFCPGDSFDLAFKTYILYKTGNEFIAELSDTNGSWSSNVKIIGKSKSIYQGKIKVGIPSDVTEGESYKIRVRSTDPVSIGEENQTSIKVYPGIPVLVNDTVLIKKQDISIIPLSPKNSTFYLYDSPVGGNLLQSARNYFSLYVYKDTVVYIEAQSLTTECKTPQRARLSIHLITDVSDIKSAESFILSPNPASDFVEIDMRRWAPLAKWSPSEGICIFNVFGQTVMTVGVQNFEPLQINVTSLTTGMYFVRIGDKVGKFVKIK